MTEHVIRHREEEGFRMPTRGKRCSRQRCGRPAVFEMNRPQKLYRGGTVDAWWGCCEVHSYGRVVVEGEVWYDPEAAERKRREVTD